MSDKNETFSQLFQLKTKEATKKRLVVNEWVHREDSTHTLGDIMMAKENKNGQA